MADAPIILGPGEGEHLRDGFTVKAGREELSVTVMRYAPGEKGPRVHVHRRHCDVFFIVEGEVVVEANGEPHTLPAGGFVLVPPNVPHTFRNESDAPASILNIHAPSMGFVESMRRIHAGEEIDPADYDQHYL